ncbi:MAG TPA: hypothetical protein VG942_16425 [Hyphomonadaceae bacterium]|nr:hypothetical protein [Hyphomonadaceae bacterium]
MMKLSFKRASAAALAASLALGAVAVPAFAQQYGSPSYQNDNGQLSGGPKPQYQPPPPQSQSPPLFSGQRDDPAFRGDDRHDRDDWRDNDWRRRKPDFQQVQRDCSRAGIQEAWNRGYYSAQYNNGPRLVEGRRGWEMQGQMRLHDRKGYSYVNTICRVNRGGVDIDFLR